MTDFVMMAVQKALYSHLTNDATLMGMVEGVFDHVPQDTACPYVTLGDVQAEVVSTSTNALCRLRIQLHIYSAAKGRKESYDIMQRLYVLLHDTTPSVTGYEIVDLKFQRSDVSLGQNGEGYHGRMLFHALIETE